MMKQKFTIGYKLYLAFIFCLPFISLGLPVGKFKFSIPDFLILLSFLSAFEKGEVLITTQFKKVANIILFFLFAVSLSVYKVSDISRYFMGLLPLLNGVLIVFLTFNYYYLYKENFLYYTKLAFMLALVICFLPAYPVFLGIKIDFFIKGYRYAYVMENPNQCMAYIFCGIVCVGILELIHLKKFSSLFFYLILFSIIPMLATGSRTGLFSFMIFLSFFFLINFRKTGVVFIAGGALGLIVLAFANLSKPNLNNNFFLNRGLSIFSFFETSKGDITQAGATGESIKLGLEAFEDNPFIGVGLGNFVGNYFVYEVHNTFVSILAETGIIGFSSYLLLLAVILVCIVRVDIPIKFKIFLYIAFALFLMMNIPHLLLRQRWTWVLFSFFYLLMFYQKKIKHVRNIWIN